MPIIEILNQYGFATLAAIAMGWFIYFIYKFTTENLKRKLGEANTALIGLLDRIRMLDNDLIRLRSKLNTVLEIQENERKNAQKRIRDYVNPLKNSAVAIGTLFILPCNCRTNRLPSYYKYKHENTTKGSVSINFLCVIGGS